MVQKLLGHCRGLVDGSRAVMSKHYAEWDRRDKVYRAERDPDRVDKDAAKHNEPVKMTVPLTTAQINTFIAFVFMVLHQRPRLFELEPTDIEDADLRELVEKGLEVDLRHNQFELQEFQFWLDIARFGIGVFKHGWEKTTAKVLVNETKTEDYNGTELDGEEVATYQEHTVFEGNKVVAVSPYRFFPDCRLPLTRFQEGEFCASEDEYSRTSLEKMESAGVVAGVKHIEAFSGDQLQKRTDGKSRFNNINLDEPESDKNMFCVTECQVWLTPSKFKDDDGVALGEEEFPVLYLVWYVNDMRVIKAEPMTVYHNSFGYEAGQMTPDQHHLMNQSLSELIDKLQGSVDWFINSRVASVKRTLDNQLVVDPAVVDMKSLENRSRVIKLQRGSARAGLDRYIKQLSVTDSTTRHMDDASVLTGIAQSVTGITDNALGQYYTGRRSATESRAVTQGGSSRLVTIIKLGFIGAYVPTGTKMISNQRQYLSQERFTKVFGQENAERYESYHGSPAELIGNTDYFVFEGTLPSEKQFMAQSLQELLGVLLSNPQAAVQFGLDPNKLLEEIYLLRGVGNIKRFQPSQEEQITNAVMQQILQQQQQGAQNV